MNTQDKVRYTIHVSGTVSDAVETLNQLLKTSGSEVLDKTNVSKITQKETGENIDEYFLLEIGNGKDVSCALDMNKAAGLVFPTKVAVYTNDQKTWGSFCKPTEALRVLGFTDLEPSGQKVEMELKQAVDAMAVKGGD